MRRFPPSWALLGVAVGLITIIGTVFSNSALKDESGWILLGVAITMLGAWIAVEVHRAMSDKRHDDEDPPITRR